MCSVMHVATFFHLKGVHLRELSQISNKSECVIGLPILLVSTDDPSSPTATVQNPGCPCDL